MEKQDKVLKKIKSSLKHGNEGQLGVKKNDECYTDMQDILNELSQWAALDKFRGKNIICPCDWDIVNGENIYSITITYKEPEVEVLGNSVFKAVKSVYVDIWSTDETPKVEHLSLKEDEIEDFLRDKLTCNFVRTLTQNARAWGIKSITASGYNPANGLGVKFQEVDYSKYDVCITNPPFSLYGEFMKVIVGKIDFIVLAPLMNRANPCVGGYLMLDQTYLGFGVHLPLTFANPTKENNYSGEKSVACDWITSFPEAQAARNEKHFKSGIKYDVYSDEYVEMIGMTMKDGTHPIRVSTSTYPEDFSGWMFASISVLDNLDMETYEWYVTECRKYFNNNPAESPFAHKACNEMYLGSDGKKNFGGIVFRKKPIN
jgi:hypothetical protein